MGLEDVHHGLLFEEILILFPVVIEIMISSPSLVSLFSWVIGRK